MKQEYKEACLVLISEYQWTLLRDLGVRIEWYHTESTKGIEIHFLHQLGNFRAWYWFDEWNILKVALFTWSFATKFCINYVPSDHANFFELADKSTSQMHFWLHSKYRMLRLEAAVRPFRWQDEGF